MSKEFIKFISILSAALLHAALQSPSSSSIAPSAPPIDAKALRDAIAGACPPLPTVVPCVCDVICLPAYILWLLAVVLFLFGLLIGAGIRWERSATGVAGPSSSSTVAAAPTSSTSSSSSATLAPSVSEVASRARLQVNLVRNRH